MLPTTHYPESMSVPRERKIPLDCAVCRGIAQLNCDDCGEPVCEECTVTCAGCLDDDRQRCIPCAIKCGYTEIDGEQYCENCSGEFEPELEAARR